LRSFIVLSFVWLALGLAIVAEAAPSPLAVENSFLSVDIDGKPFRLQAMIVKEAARTGRLPVALITHGQSNDLAERLKVDPASYIFVAREFARRGWLAVVVARRGFGKSTGSSPYALQACRRGDYGATFKPQIDDMAAALQAVARRADADANRVVGFGTSVGGVVMLGLAARAPQGLRAVVNMSGGALSFPAPGADQSASCWPEHLPPLFAEYAKTSRVPTLWLYAENDSFFPADYVRQLQAAYVAAGGLSDFYLFPPLKGDGHNLYSLHDGMQHWIPTLDAFLRRRDLPTYDPLPLDAAVRKILNPQASAYYNNLYRTRPAEKAMALSPSGKQGFIAFGRGTAEQAAQDSLAGCAKQAGGQPCRLVLQNFEVVPAP
jgi:dienelactone hydrolase